VIDYANEFVALTVADLRQVVHGQLVDQSAELIVLYDGIRFMYVPLVHIEQLTRYPSPSGMTGKIPESPLGPAEHLSHRKVLLNAKGVFAELYVAGNRTIHGYVTSVMTDFFVFHSPLHRSLCVSMRHLKIFAPYDDGQLPYALGPNRFPFYPPTAPLARTFDRQLQKFENEFVILDLGEQPRKSGLLKSVANNLVELAAADGTSTYIHLDHVRTIHLP